MPKKAFLLSKKHEKLIDIECAIPNIKEIRQLGNKDWVILDHRGNAEYSLIETIEIMSTNTQYEEVCKSIIKKCKDIFENIDN